MDNRRKMFYRAYILYRRDGRLLFGGVADIIPYKIYRGFFSYLNLPYQLLYF